MHVSAYVSERTYIKQPRFGAAVRSACHCATTRRFASGSARSPSARAGDGSSALIWRGYWRCASQPCACSTPTRWRSRRLTYPEQSARQLRARARLSRAAISGWPAELERWPADAAHTRWLALVRVFALPLLCLELSLREFCASEAEIVIILHTSGCPRGFGIVDTERSGCGKQARPSSWRSWTTASAAKPMRHSAIPGAFCWAWWSARLSVKSVQARLRSFRCRQACPRLCNGTARSRVAPRSRSSSTQLS